MARTKVRRPLADQRLREATLELARELVRHENVGRSRFDLLEEAAGMLLELFQCEAVEVWPGRGTGTRRYGIRRGGSGSYLPLPGEASRLAEVCRGVACGEVDAALRVRMREGALLLEEPQEVLGRDLDGSWGSLAVMPCGDGALVLAGPARGWFKPKEIPFLVDIARIVGIALAIQQPREALGERVKELTCLYGLSRLAQQSELPLGDLLQGIARLIPPAWQHPEHAHCRISFDSAVFESPGFKPSPLRQGASILVKETQRGWIEVFYDQDVPGIDGERPFLPEERNLIEGLAREVALVIERRQLANDRERLWEQIRHMDRLATIGQLAASVAHELNEPLCSILGLAQLAIKDRELSPQARGDLRKIVESSLHAREVVKSLLGFSRAEPARMAPVSLNRIIEDALGLFTARCARAKVTIQLELDHALPRVNADPSQIHQVLVNLIVNAIQAMPEGGTLTLGTSRQRGWVRLFVADDGIGMNDETLRQIFEPFFTTKEAGHGTGLGLGIVQNIIATLGGTLAVESQPGRGSRFTLEMPVGDQVEPRERQHE